MPILVCEYCGKPFNNVGVKLCPACSKIVEDSYIKARRYIYKNPKTSDFISIVDETEIPEKALSYLIKKGRIEIANKAGGGPRCRACGKETLSGTICDQCRARLLSEKLAEKTDEAKRELTNSDLNKRMESKSFGDNLRKSIKE